MAGAVVLNAALVILLSAWNLTGGQAFDPPHRAVPLEVVDLPDEEMEIVTDEVLAAPAAAEAPAPPELPAPPMPQAGAIIVPEYSDDLPDFAPERIETSLASRLPGATKATGPASLGDPSRTRGPVLIQPPDLAGYYPRRAKIDGVTGKTTLRLDLSARGSVMNVTVISSTPEGVFETAAKRAAKTLTFRPALRNGQAIAVTTRLVMKWKLED